MSDKSPFFDPGPGSASSAPTMVPGRGAARLAPPPSNHAAGGETVGSQVTLRGRTAPRGERLRAGDVLLGRYTVLSELGEGGMGVVYKCLDNVGGIEVALKCLPPELSRNEAEMEGIRENYAIVARLHHSAISGLRNLEKDPDFGEYYLVMDLAEGEDLSAVLRRRHGAPMPPAEALAILRPLASALDYAHGEKVLHRDVKPGNVKVATAGGASRPGEPTLVTRHSSPVTPKIRVQLLDFGLAAEVRSSMSRVSLRGHAGTSGTPAYMAPEQWEARRQSAATDQYALAVMAYQMLSGALPFDADNTDLLRRAVLSREADPVPSLPRAANAALLRALAKDPAGRFPTCTAFVEALARATCAPRRRIPAWLAAAALVAVAAGIFLTQGRRGAEQGGGGLQPAATSQGGGGLQTAVTSQGSAAAKAAEAVALAEAAKISEDWDAVLVQSKEALRYQPQNASALALKREAEAEKMKIAEAKAEAERKAAQGVASRPGEPQRGGGLPSAVAERKAAQGGASRPGEPQRGGGLQSAVGANGGLETAAPLAGRVTDNGHEGVQLWEGGPYWAETNIGADKPEDSGFYFWWGDTVGYRREGDAWVASDGSSRNFKIHDVPTFGKDNATLRREGWTTAAGILAPAYDAAHVHWGGDWRMPTKQELDDLGSKCDWTWTTRNGVSGYLVRGQGAYVDASIFLPAAGYGYGASLGFAGSCGCYWSSVPDEGGSSNAWGLGFSSGDHDADYDYRDNGRSVRPVQGFAK